MTNPSSKLEHVARAMLEAADWTDDGQPGEEIGWDAMPSFWKESYLTMARAAIAAMEVPTEQAPPSWGELQPRAALKEEKVGMGNDQDFPTERAMRGPYHTDSFGSKIYGTSDGDETFTALDVRGWGFLIGRGHGGLGLEESAALIEQKRFAAFVVWALNKAEEESKEVAHAQA